MVTLWVVVSLLQDNSAAFFATGNVAISRRLLLKGGNLLTSSGYDGPFDADFSEYGWEDLELGGMNSSIPATYETNHVVYEDACVRCFYVRYLLSGLGSQCVNSIQHLNASHSC